jgi:ComF family protein
MEKSMKTDKIFNILFPRRCPVCGEVVRAAGGLVCPSCLSKFSFVKNPVCKICGKEVLDETVELCADCMKHRHAFDYGVALLHYNEAARHSMAQIKYENKREYLELYGEFLAARYRGRISRMHADAIVPVPVHESRMRARGFNQAQLLAEILGRKLGIPVMPELLKRTKKTAPQKELSAAERLKNLTGAFEAGEIPASVKSVLIADDIYTTGSTVEACARALRSAGVEHVYFAVICTTGGRESSLPERNGSGTL